MLEIQTPPLFHAHQLFLLKKYSSKLGGKRDTLFQNKELRGFLYGLLTDIKNNVFKAITLFSFHFSKKIGSPRKSRDGLLCLPRVDPEAVYLCQFRASSISWAQPAVQEDLHETRFVPKVRISGFVCMFNIQSSFYTYCSPKRPLSNGCRVSCNLRTWDEVVALVLNVFSFMTVFQIHFCWFF